jgi:hypothetical protein
MVIFKKAIPRRTFLRGLGTAIALPMLDAMVPACARAAGKSPIRLGIVYVPNGMWPMDKWTPKAEGAAFEITPILEPISNFRDKLTVVTGLAHKEGLAIPSDPGAPHAHTFATFLTGVRPKATSGKDFQVGVSMDQVAAQKLGKETQLASLEVSLFSSDLVGNCEPGFTCTYVNTLSWRTPTTPLPMEHNPRALFERLFGDSDNTDRAARLARIREQRSILDGVTKLASRFMGDIGPSDRAKLTEYLDAIRDTERRIQIAEKEADHEVPSVERPAGTPASFEDYAKLMMDLQVLTYQTDLTRVITFAMEHEGGGGSRAYPEIGIPDQHHTLSHHQNSSVSIDKLFQIHRYHMRLFAYYLERLRSVPDGDGNLLDNTILLYGSGLSDGNSHLHENLPMILVGGAGGKIKGGRHLRFPDGTAMTNLHLTVLDKLGVPVEKLGDSTGKLDLLSV